MMRRSLTLFVMAAATAACGESITSAFRTTAARPPYLDGPVTVSMAREPADGTTLAIVQVQSDRTDIDRLMKAFVARVAEEGGNYAKIDEIETATEERTTSETETYDCGTAKKPKQCTESVSTTKQVVVLEIVGRAIRTRGGEP
jgi:hypothetical protein